MFARMTIMHIRVDKIDEAITIYKKSVIPAAKRQKGYKGASLLVNRKEGRGVSITFWTNEKDAVANEESRYYQEQLVKFVGLMAGPLIREEYELTLRDGLSLIPKSD